jgi:hypothetical protein
MPLLSAARRAITRKPSMSVWMVHLVSQVWARWFQTLREIM